MSDFDDFAAANQGGLRPARRPGDAVLRARARTPDTQQDWTRGAGLSPPPQTALKKQGGLVDGIAAYKRMAGRTGLAETTKGTKPVVAPIGATRTPSARDGTKPSGAPANFAPTGPRPNAKWSADRARGAGSVGDLGGDLGGATARVSPKPRPAATGLVGTPDPTPRPRRSDTIFTTVPDSRSPGAVDGLIAEIMRFAETLTGVGPQQKHDRVAEIWSWPYRGTYQPGTWGRESIPAVGTHAILDGVATRWPDMIPPHLRDDPDIRVQDDGTVIRHTIARYDPTEGAGAESRPLGPGQAGSPGVRLLGAEGSRTGTGGDHEAEDGLISARHLEAALAEDRDRPRHKDRAGDVQVAFDGDWFDIPGIDGPLGDGASGQPAPPPEDVEARVIDGTVFYGGAGLEGDYIDDMVKALEEAGMFEPRAVDPEGRTLGMHLDAFRSGTSLRERDDEALEPFEFRQSEDPHNLVGYSYGSLKATQEALDLADVGVRVDNLVLIGSPISSEMLKEAMEHPNIGQVVVVDLTEHGDPIHAGMSSPELYGSVPKLFEQMETRQTTGEGHFYYAPSNETGALRRRELADQILDQMRLGPRWRD
jgi:hypothetical protein